MEFIILTFDLRAKMNKETKSSFQKGIYKLDYL